MLTLTPAHSGNKPFFKLFYFSPQQSHLCSQTVPADTATTSLALAGRMQWQFLECSKPILGVLPVCFILIAEVFSCLCTLLAAVVLFMQFDGVCG